MIVFESAVRSTRFIYIFPCFINNQCIAWNGFIFNKPSITYRHKECLIAYSPNPCSIVNQYSVRKEMQSLTTNGK